MTALILCAAAAFVLAAVFGMIFIPMLRRLKFGQEIREAGPSWHKNKSGTPTMGGIIFIAAISVTVILCWCAFNVFGAETVFGGVNIKFSQAAILLTALGFGAVGFIDDYIKVVKKRNLGLNEKQKFLAQAVVAVLFTIWAYFLSPMKSEIFIPFTDKTFNLGILYIPFVLFVMLGGVNSVNLTDGLDGLAASVTAVVSLFFCAVFMVATNLLTIYGFRAELLTETYAGSAFFAAALFGGLLGFLLYNKYPAKVFMGDTGSLFLGGAVSAMAVVLGNPLVLILVGFVYICETLSVIIQVTVYKKTGKRVFKMSPLHHHFEMCGWSERKVVAVFTLITVILCAVAYFAIF